MFQPPRCPNRFCPHHRQPRGRWFVCKGSYRVLCRPLPIPRFCCRSCRKGFSRQTFRMDYRDHRPDLNPRLLRSLASGLGLRQTSRNLRLTLRCTELKFRKIARHLRRLNLNLRGPLPQGSILQFDEIETFEGRRNTRPLSLPILIEKKSRYVIWAESAPIRPHGRMSPARRKALAQDDNRYGKRRDLSRRSVQRTLRRGNDLAENLPRISLLTDEKATYPKIASKVFGADRLDHQRTNSKLPRTTCNPLFAINHTEAMARDLMGRLRRESWLASKKRRYLDLALQLWMTYRCYIRRRFNHDRQSAAQVLGFVDRRMSETQVLSWRQDWARRSIHPLAGAGESVDLWARRRASP